MPRATIELQPSAGCGDGVPSRKLARSRVIVLSQVWQALVGCRRVPNVEPYVDCFRHDRAFFSLTPIILGDVIDA